MKTSFKFPLLRYLAVPCILVASSLSPAAAAPVTFAQYFQMDGAQQAWNVSTSGTTTTVTASGAVLFNFSGVSGLPFSGPETANFSLSATSDQWGNCGVNCGAGDSYVQPGYTGTFSFIDTGSAPGANLLSGTFSVTGSPSTTGAQFSSSVGGSGGSFNASATAGNLDQLILTSQYLNFAGQDQENASWSLSSLQPNFATGVVVGNQAFPSDEVFAAAGSGTFSSNPGPTLVQVPEPSALSLLALFLIGAGFIIKKKSANRNVTGHSFA